YVLPDVPLEGAASAEHVESLRAATIPAEVLERETARSSAAGGGDRAVVVGASFGAAARTVAAPDEAGAEAASAPVLALYVGNLEHYQGMDLLLDAIACLPPDLPLYTAVIGGNMASVKRYRTLANELGIARRIRFFGARPVRDLN